MLLIFVVVEGWSCFVDSELCAFGLREAEKKLKNCSDLVALELEAEVQVSTVAFCTRPVPLAGSGIEGTAARRPIC